MSARCVSGTALLLKEQSNAIRAKLCTAPNAGRGNTQAAVPGLAKTHQRSEYTDSPISKIARD